MNTKCGNRRCVIDVETTNDQWTGQLVCIGILNIDSENQEIQSFTGSYEEMVLKNFLRYFNNNQFDEIIGYNLCWDIRVVLSRCMKYRLRADAIYRARCTDLMMILKGFGKGYNYNEVGSLDMWSKFLGGPGKIKTEASIEDLYKMGRWSEIIEYNIRDLKLTYDLWDRLNIVIGRQNQ